MTDAERSMTIQFAMKVVVELIENPRPGITDNIRRKILITFDEPYPIKLSMGERMILRRLIQEMLIEHADIITSGVNGVKQAIALVFDTFYPSYYYRELHIKKRQTL